MVLYLAGTTGVKRGVLERARGANEGSLSSLEARASSGNASNASNASNAPQQLNPRDPLTLTD